MSHCIIVGAGIVGLATAHRLIQEGYRLTIIDQGLAGQQSSWAGGGILSPLHPWRYLPQAMALVDYSLRFYPKFIQDIKEHSGIDPEFVQSGALFIDRESIIQGQDWAKKNDKPFKILDRHQLSILEPELVGHEKAILFSEIFQLRTPRLLKALKRSLRLQGVDIKENNPLQGLEVSNHGVEGVKTESGFIEGSKVIICCGAWTGVLLKRLRLREQAIRPVKGQMLLFDAKAYPLKHVVLDQRYYLIPRQDGLLLAGSTMEEAGFNNATTNAGREEIHKAALRLMPNLSFCDIKHHWAGLRPGSPNGVPTIAKHPQVEGLYINGGHFRNGLAMAVGSACFLADLISNKPCTLDPRPYSFVDTKT